ncbi:MAG: sigma-70 family RNA polymerase sigma factor [Motiliproteus sp.]
MYATTTKAGAIVGTTKGAVDATDNPIGNANVSTDEGSDNSTDENLMLAYAGGSYSAFETLYGRYRGPVLRFYRRQTQPPALAEELLHEAFIRLIKARKQYQPTARFRVYFWRIVRNLLVDHYRSQSRTLPEPFGEADPELTLADHIDQPEVHAEQNQQLTRLLALVQQLPADQRDAFLLKEEAELSLAEIAELTDCGTETVKSRLRYAIIKLRSGMEERQ